VGNSRDGIDDRRAGPPPSCGQFIVEGTERHAVLRVTGEVDIASRSEFQDQLDRIAVRVPATVVVDLRDLEFLDAEGASALIETARTVTALGGSVVVRSPQPIVQRVFDILGYEPAVIEH